MCEIYRDGKAPKQVKNLGWLLRHWKDVKNFDVCLSGNSFPSEYTLTAFSDDWFFITDYASLSVLHSWLNRPVFVGLPINWLSANQVKIGSLEYAKLSPDIAS
jgi:hypothetical protein